MNIDRIVIIYDGTIGMDLAKEAEGIGLTVDLFDMRDDFMQKILNQYSAPAKKGYRHGVQRNFSKNSYIQIFKDVDIILECTEESLNTKKILFKFLDQICPAKTIFATNCFSFNLTVIAAETKRPAKVIGLHIDNQGNVVEIIRNVATSDETVLRSKEFLQKLKKKILEFSDYPPHLIHHMIMPMINEAAYFLMQGVSTAPEIDNLMRIGANLPIGPLALADLIGLDDCLIFLERLYASTGDNKFYPCHLFYKYVKSNWLGCKTRRGFHNYQDSLSV
ncbi:3-hydroxyacyl-CoA dehydrogenase NAD-binding domain-containing protein [Desulfoscipio geothermicus]|uniref:3-hydroxybutyryl-CoA dehydrogenase n=1 Tax=Desulfoscipio geothermicus DSM 3669 TaxID=1121426 RepID=A0A1I6CQF5_9FIRM|nr:3-hydroxyacyl-CoA dehydrogenase NAD-binding domain-containing protein [Desulfoscipio geothermicus]SFQ95349.1 3-hydroxybutyryl-CoA dehydrogenase [Desulfoscipio geothermicus DSM 3669]